MMLKLERPLIMKYIYNSALKATEPATLSVLNMEAYPAVPPLKPPAYNST
jgi:hypothetical protein